MHLLALIYLKFVKFSGSLANSRVNIHFKGLCLDGGLFDIYGPIGAKIELLKWNCNSQLPAALLRDEELPASLVSDEELSSIQNWGFGNYHWYLKRKWSYFGQEQVNVCLNSERPIHCIF